MCWHGERVFVCVRGSSQHAIISLAPPAAAEQMRQDMQRTHASFHHAGEAYQSAVNKMHQGRLQRLHITT